MILNFEKYNSEIFSAKEIVDHIVDITPNEENIPTYFLETIKNSGSSFQLKKNENK